MSKSKSPTGTKKPANRTAAKKAVVNNSVELHSKDAATENNSYCEKSSCSKKKLIIATIIVILVGAFLAVKFGHKKSDTAVEVKRSANGSAKVETVEDVENVIAGWVQNNPELILESVINMQKKQAEKQTQDSVKNISKKAKDLYNRKEDPTLTPSGYDVTLVEFFDYNCGYCKKAISVVEELANKDVKVKIVFKELPILGPSSEELAKISLAFNMIAPNKYFEFHRDLMKAHIDPQGAYGVAESHGVSTAKIKKVLAKFKDEIEKEILFNRELASAIGINGTPAFLIGENLFPGALSYEAIEEAINAERKKK